jgi:hypothetical protein
MHMTYLDIVTYNNTYEQVTSKKAPNNKTSTHSTHNIQQQTEAYLQTDISTNRPIHKHMNLQKTISYGL